MDFLSAFSKAVGVVESFTGLKPASSSVLSAPDDVSSLAAMKTKLSYWYNLLDSRNRLEVSRTPGSKMAQAISIWNTTKYQDASSAVDDAISQAQDIVSENNGGVSISAQDFADAGAAKAKAQTAYDDAVSYAQKISDHITADTAAAAKTVTVGTVLGVLPPVAVAQAAYKASGDGSFTGTVLNLPSAAVQSVAAGVKPAYQAAASEAASAASAIGRTASAAVSQTSDLLKYAGYGAIGLAALYALVLVKSTLPNPRRRRRA